MWSVRTDAKAMTFIRSYIAWYIKDAGIGRNEREELHDLLRAKDIYEVCERMNNLTNQAVSDTYTRRFLNNALYHANKNFSLRRIRGSRELSRQDCAIKIKEVLCDFYNTCKLHKDAFDWINIENPRLCLFVFSALIERTYQRNCYLDPYWTEQYVWTSLFLEESPQTISGIKKEINKFFDVWGISVEKKNQLLSELKSQYQHVCKYHRAEEWFSNNSDLSQWAWNYIKNNHYNNVCPPWYEIHANSKLTRYVIISSFDLILNEKERDYLMLLMSKYGAQQKYRTKVGNDKPVQVTIRKSIKDMLVKKSQIEGIPYKQLLEKIIRDSCS